MSKHPLSLWAPPSKSVTHRAFILGALSGDCTVENPLLGADCRATLAAVEQLGAVARLDTDRVLFSGFDPQPSTDPIDCENSGTSLRLLSALAARFDFAVSLTGDDSLRRRPNGPLLTALAGLGVRVTSHDGRAPLSVQGPLQAGEVVIDGSVSSQFTSGLLLALAQTQGPSRVVLTPPVASRPYLDLSQEVAAAFGLTWSVHPHEGGLRFEIPGGQRPRCGHFVVEGDWSGAAFPLVAAAIRQRPLKLLGLDPKSRQGDRAIVDIMTRFGQTFRWDDKALTLTPGALKSAGFVDLEATPDLFPALCALAAVTPGETTLGGAPSLRHKECDRIAAMAQGLQRLGITVKELSDGLTIRGGDLGQGSIESFGDHRVHMAFALLHGVGGGQIEVDHPNCVAVSYPGFHADLAVIVDAASAP